VDGSSCPRRKRWPPTFFNPLMDLIPPSANASITRFISDDCSLPVCHSPLFVRIKIRQPGLDPVVNPRRSGSSGGFVLGDKLDVASPVQVSTTRLGKCLWFCHRCDLAGDSAFNVSFAGLRILLSCQLAPLRPKDAKSHPSTSARASVTGAADDFRPTRLG